MSNSSKSKTPSRSVIRQNEGVGLDVTREVIPQTNGTSISVIGISLEHAPVPDRRYVADVATVIYKKGTIKLIFAQETIASELRSMLVIHMTTNAVKQFLSSLDQMKPLNLDELMKKLNLEPEELFEAKSEPEQTVALAANMSAIAIAGNETCLDFYLASAFAMANITKASKVPIDPVVRVDLRTSLFLSIIDKFRELDSNFPTEPS